MTSAPPPTRRNKIRMTLYRNSQNSFNSISLRVRWESTKRKKTKKNINYQIFNKINKNTKKFFPVVFCLSWWKTNNFTQVDNNKHNDPHHQPQQKPLTPDQNRPTKSTTEALTVLPCTLIEANEALLTVLLCPNSIQLNLRCFEKLTNLFHTFPEVEANHCSHRTYSKVMWYTKTFTLLQIFISIS
jgi:hypothetical protein